MIERKLILEIVTYQKRFPNPTSAINNEKFSLLGIKETP